MVPGELLVAASVALTLDQSTKKLVLHRYRRRSRGASRWAPRIHVVLNERLGFGPLDDRWPLLMLWATCVIGLLVLLPYASVLDPIHARLGLGAALGGATSNLCDRLYRGAVVDFIDVRIWPIFNLADTSIVVGVAAALWPIYSHILGRP